MATTRTTVNCRQSLKAEKRDDFEHHYLQHRVTSPVSNHYMERSSEASFVVHLCLHVSIHWLLFSYFLCLVLDWPSWPCLGQRDRYPRCNIGHSHLNPLRLDVSKNWILDPSTLCLPCKLMIKFLYCVLTTLFAVTIFPSCMAGPILLPHAWPLIHNLINTAFLFNEHSWFSPKSRHPYRSLQRDLLRGRTAFA